MRKRVLKGHLMQVGRDEFILKSILDVFDYLTVDSVKYNSYVIYPTMSNIELSILNDFILLNGFY